MGDQPQAPTSMELAHIVVRCPHTGMGITLCVTCLNRHRENRMNDSEKIKLTTLHQDKPQNKVLSQ